MDNYQCEVEKLQLQVKTLKEQLAMAAAVSSPAASTSAVSTPEASTPAVSTSAASTPAAATSTEADDNKRCQGVITIISIYSYI